MITDFMPKSLLGKWAVRLGITLVVILGIELVFAFAISGDPTVIERSVIVSLLATILSFAFSLVAPLSFLVGMIAIVKQKDWSVITSLAVLYMLTALLFLLGEFLFPH